MRIQFLTLLVICLLLSPILACDSAFDLLFADSPHPSDAMLETNFYKHEADLNSLTQMAIEDADMIRIAPDFTWHKDNVDGNASKAALGFSDERYDRYKEIFRRIGKNNGILNYQPPTKCWC